MGRSGSKRRPSGYNRVRAQSCGDKGLCGRGPEGTLGGVEGAKDSEGL